MSDEQAKAGMEYTVVAESNLGDFVNWVNRHLADGWKPQGGIAVCLVGDIYPTARVQYMQALVRKPSAAENKADSWSFDEALFEARVRHIVEGTL